jgi:diguanylate cyclase (GGDEF)-like protein
MDGMAEPRFWNDTIYTNIYRVIRYMCLLLVIHAALIAVDLIRLRSGAMARNPAYVSLFIAHLVTVAVLIGYCGVHQLTRPSSPNDVRPVHAVMLTAMGSIFLLVCTVITLIDQSIQGQITVYTMGVLIVATAVYVPLQISVPAFVLNHCVFLVALSHAGLPDELLYSHYMNSSIVVAVAILITKLVFDSNRSVHEDISLIHRQQGELERLAVEDALTGLFNRRYIDGRLREESQRAERYDRVFSVALADIDHFKGVNDTYSHQIGDVVLMRLATVFREEVRGVDVVARFGGEEFLLLFPETTDEQAAAVCEKIRTSIEGHNWAEVADGLGVTASFGVADSLNGTDVGAILRVADELLYKAKHSGRNRVESTADLHNSTTEDA